eukprot:scaffold501_cov355-Pinguiococcus_pyrenoidosus.AAC.5
MQSSQTSSKSEQKAAPPLTLENIPLAFPFEPYDVQRKFMTAVLRALKGGQNAILESPTGTGKTLCLLVSTLAFKTCQKHGGPIVYASRTHSQLSQVVNELKRTDYKVSVSLLASREQLCVKSSVRKLQGGRQVAACGALTKKGKCGFKLGNEKHVHTQEILDVEELAKKGIQER